MINRKWEGMAVGMILEEGNSVVRVVVVVVVVVVVSQGIGWYCL